MFFGQPIVFGGLFCFFLFPAEDVVNGYAEEIGIPFDGSLAPSSEILVRVNGNYVDFDQPPAIVNDRTLVPVRAIFEAMGINVDWDNITITAIATRDNTEIRLTIDSNIMRKTVDGVQTDITIDVPAMILGDRTMVPARAPLENFGASVKWDGKTRTVIVTD